MSSSSFDSSNGTPGTLSAAVQQAFTFLTTYDRGSARAPLLPIDEAVAGSKTHDRFRKDLESRLINILSGGSETAKDYACAKLASIGGEASVPALSALLAHPRLATSARTALEAIPSERAAKALRDGAAKLKAPEKIGAILSLGVRRDARSTRMLVAFLRSEDPQVQSAAAASLGQIATTGASKALRAFLPKAPQPIRMQVADACLVCAKRRAQENHTNEAAILYSVVATAGVPGHVLSAAKRGMAACVPAVRT